MEEFRFCYSNFGQRIAHRWPSAFADANGGNIWGLDQGDREIGTLADALDWLQSVADDDGWR